MCIILNTRLKKVKYPVFLSNFTGALYCLKSKIIMSDSASLAGKKYAAYGGRRRGGWRGEGGRQEERGGGAIIYPGEVIQL